MNVKVVSQETRFYNEMRAGATHEEEDRKE